MRLVIKDGPELGLMSVLHGRGMRTFVFTTTGDVRIIATLTSLLLDNRPGQARAIVKGSITYIGVVYHFRGYFNAVGAGIFELGTVVNIPACVV